jgi:glutathione synthase/RimK-type ligase-like ATP-grasp enzyme
MSTIIKKSFYLSLTKEHKCRNSLGLRGPLMIDPPEAIISSFDKRITHGLFPNLVPESYVLTGKNNKKKIERFKDDQFVVIKPLQGWWGEGVERLSPQDALKKHGKSKALIVQKYIPPDNGVGRIVTILHKNDFEIAASYTRVSRSWRTGTDMSYTCHKQPVTNKLREFALMVSRKCGLYLNGIDYIYYDGQYILLEINAVPAMKEPKDAFGIDIPKKLLTHIERNIK